MNDLLDRIEDSGIRIVEVKDDKIGGMAFADNLVLLCNDSSQMLLLQVNGKKCASLRILPVRDKVSMKVISETHRWWQEISIPSTDFDHLSSYLCVKLRPDERIDLLRQEWKDSQPSMD